MEPEGQTRKESSQGIAQDRQNTMRTESRESISKQLSSRKEHSRRAQAGEIIGKEIARNLKTESLELREEKYTRNVAEKSYFSLRIP